MVPGTGNAVNLMQLENNGGVMEPTSLDRIIVGFDYVEGMGIEVIQGRAFSDNDISANQQVMMVNESMVRKMGWDNPIGKQVGVGENPFEIIGVTRDFHYAPLHNEIGALLIHPNHPDYSNTPVQTRPLQNTSIVVNITGENVGETMTFIEETIMALAPTQIFNPRFLDELYTSETNLMNLTEIFAAICILISTVGLFGLAAFTTQQRYKEIGIRKVLGASSVQIVSLLTRNLLLLVAVAAVPSSIISFYALNYWLEKFAYRTDINLAPFLAATLAVTLVTLITVASQAMKGSNSNPVESLRYE
ncbi:MAG TPA: hypothetical protein DCM64_08435 [Gammaproteobacteria bacterium]|jgi:putative ABC transport system permease protein|nr:hypothetical protein [Gammaproteobacteria bacterium]|tara:strand:- start:2184 stop:3095 length:912 start_codon:yes stop_codon:yes gene_type:complete